MSEHYHIPNNSYYSQQQHPVPYGVHPQPAYQPQHQQARWAHDQVASQKYYSSPEYELEYAGQQPQHHGVGNSKGPKPGKFKTAPQYNDVWATFAFLIQMGGFIAISYFAVSNIIKVGFLRTGEKDIIEKDFFLSTKVFITFALGIAVSVVYSYIYLILTQLFPLWSMTLTYWFILLIFFGSGAYCIYVQNWFTAAFFLILGILFAGTYMKARERIKSSAVLLKEVTTVARHSPIVFLLSSIGLFLQILCNIHILVVITGLRQMFSADGSSSSLHNGLQILSYLSFYWLSQVLTNIVHVTVSGIFATHYFKPDSKSPTLPCLKLACTSSFGTICFGGLIYAIIQTIKNVFDFLRGNNYCMLGVLEGCYHFINETLDFINPLVYSEVSIYGKPFMTAARDAYKIIKERGLDMVLNDIIISTVWGISAFFGALVAAVGGQTYLSMALGGDSSNRMKGHGLEVWVVTGLIFMLGMQVIFTTGAVVQSGVSTIFIALAEDPEILARTRPEFFAKMQEAYPDMVEGVGQ